MILVTLSTHQFIREDLNLELETMKFQVADIEQYAFRIKNFHNLELLPFFFLLLLFDHLLLLPCSMAHR